MKKIISIFLFVLMFAIGVSAEEINKVEGLHEQLNELFLENYFTEEQMEQMEREYIDEFNEFWPGILEGLHALGKDQNLTDEEKYEKKLNNGRPEFPKGIKCSFLELWDKYKNQYADENKLYMLFSDNEYWGVLAKNNMGLINYGFDGSLISPLGIFGNNSYVSAFDDKQYEFLKNESAIEKMLLEANETKVQDIKIFAISNAALMYIRCEKNEYLVVLSLNLGMGGIKEFKDLEMYKLYSAKEFINNIAENYPSSDIAKSKPTYETEAVSLQEEGLLYGNENGLDLLKPLTRIEAATMLLRALGESTESTANVQVFSDVPESHWGYGAAENAYSLGLIKGVGDNKFVPDEKVTSAQFATMVLRAANQSEFDWEKAVDLLIEQGIITAENAETMDLFTRGDMAKIIYEARQKGLLH